MTHVDRQHHRNQDSRYIHQSHDHNDLYWNIPCNGEQYLSTSANPSLACSGIALWCRRGRQNHCRRQYRPRSTLFHHDPSHPTFVTNDSQRIIIQSTICKQLFIPLGCPREPNQTGKLVHCNRPLASCGYKYTYQMRYIVHDHCTRWHIHSRRDVSARRAIARRKVVVYTFHPLVGRLGSPKSNNVDVLDKRIFLTHNNVVFLLFKRASQGCD